MRRGLSLIRYTTTARDLFKLVFVELFLWSSVFRFSICTETFDKTRRTSVSPMRPAVMDVCETRLKGSWSFSPRLAQSSLVLDHLDAVLGVVSSKSLPCKHRLL